MAKSNGATSTKTPNEIAQECRMRPFNINKKVIEIHLFDHFFAVAYKEMLNAPNILYLILYTIELVKMSG